MFFDLFHDLVYFKLMRIDEFLGKDEFIFLLDLLLLLEFLERVL